MIVVQDQQSVIPSNDRIALYGDGCFTTIAISQSKPEFLDFHLTRLEQDCRRLFIDFQLWRELKNAITGLALSKVSGVLKVVISRGQGGRGYSPNSCTNPIAYLSLSEMPDHYQNWRENGISMSISSVKLAIQPLLAGIKHLNRLEQIFVKRELDQIEFDDLLVCDLDGRVVESSAGNVFWRKSKKWFTPKLDRCGVEGVMRNRLLKFFQKENIQIEQIDSPAEELIDSDELLITNSLMRIVPVNSLQINEYTKHWNPKDSHVKFLQSDLVIRNSV